MWTTDDSTTKPYGSGRYGYPFNRRANRLLEYATQLLDEEMKQASIVFAKKARIEWKTDEDSLELNFVPVKDEIDRTQFSMSLQCESGIALIQKIVGKALKFYQEHDRFKGVNVFIDIQQLAETTPYSILKIIASVPNGGGTNLDSSAFDDLVLFERRLKRYIPMGFKKKYKTPGKVF